MFTKSKIAAIALTSTLAFTANAQAENVSLDKYVSVMVNQAMDVAQQELKNNLRSTILTVANNVSFNEEKSYTAKVSITDLKSENVEVSKTQAE
ncbi:MAG: triosephosphate isomerase [Paraglaciecola sp.]|jgi:triosephosphate isomerase